MKGVEHTLTVERTARYFTAGGAQPREIWFVLHGYGQRAEVFLRSFRCIAVTERLIVAPEALSRFYVVGSRGAVGASWMTSELRDQEISDYVEYLDSVRRDVLARLNERAARIVVLGFSQGVATATRWAMRGEAVDRLILWGGLLPPEARVGPDIGRLAAMDISIVIGARDQYIDAEQAELERQRLSQLENRIAWIDYPGEHRIEADLLRELADGVHS